MCDQSGARKRMKMDDGGKKMEQKESVCDWNSLPQKIITRTLSYLSFHHIAQCRMVCRSFNRSGKHLLNEQAEKMIDVVSWPYERSSVLTLRPYQWQKLKAKNYDCFKDIRRSMRTLYRLYKPYMNDNSSCFVAGKVLDSFYAKLSMPPNEVNRQLSEELYRLKDKASTHFIENIIPFIVRFHSPSERAKAATAHGYQLLDYIMGSNRPRESETHEKIYVMSDSEKDSDEEIGSEEEDNNLLNPVQVWDSEDTDGEDINHEYYEKKLRKKFNLDSESKK